MNGDEGSFLNLTGFSREAFEELHEVLYLGHQNHRGHGRPGLLDTRNDEIFCFFLGLRYRSTI